MGTDGRPESSTTTSKRKRHCGGSHTRPFAFGALKDSTGNNNWGLALVSATCLIAAAMVVGLKFVKQAEATARIAEEEADAQAQLVTTGELTK